MYTSEDLQKSVNAVNTGEMSVRDASRAFKVLKSTIDCRRNSVFVEKLALTGDSMRKFKMS